MQVQTLVNGAVRPTDWSAVNWRVANRQVRSLRQRIFRAAQAGDFKKMRSLQKLMLRSYSNRLLAVRRVTQVNQGKNTPGVDKLLVKTPTARGRLVDQLGQLLDQKSTPAKPLRRVYIAKPNGKLRPLGIPTIVDRCQQAVVKNALEPEWESRFEGSSYGFRPGRSCHDAIEKIYGLARPNKTKPWVVDADIKGAFDNIAHKAILEHIGKFPAREMIARWLRAGYIQDGTFYATETGAAQGAVISPLLANIALHGMEAALGVKHDNRGGIISKRAVVRYADDFAVFCTSREDAERVIEQLHEWLAQRGLQLSAEKTRIVHLREGFDFLGFNIKHYQDKRRPSGYKLWITPSKAAVTKLKQKLRELWRALRGTNVATVLQQLNPIIRGWANYYHKVVATKTFNKLDYWMWKRELCWVKYRHRQHGWAWRRARYWGQLNTRRQDKWVFGDKEVGGLLLKFSWFKIQRHVLVIGKSSPDDPRLREYWEKRRATQTSTLRPMLQAIARRQQYVCPECGESLFNEEELHNHHIRAKSAGGGDEESNRELVHLYCHQAIHGGPAMRRKTRKDEQVSMSN